MTTPEVRLNWTMARQHSVATRRQALAAGLTARQVDVRLGTGAWVSAQRGVYRPIAVRPYFEQEAMAACLAVDAFTSHRGAARLWRLRGFPHDVVEVTVTRDRRTHLHEVRVYRDDHLGRRDTTTLGPIPITTPARTLLDIAVVAPDLLEGALNDALCRGLTRPERVRSTLARAGGGGRRGVPVLAEHLDRLAAPTESTLEDDFLALIRRHGLPEPLRQYPIAGGRFRLDCAWPGPVVAVEIHGWRHHSSPADRRRDRDKHRAARAEGWNLRHAYWEDIHEWGDDTAVELAVLLEEGHVAA